MIHITHKETKKKYDNICLDDVLNVDLIKEVGDDIDNILFESWKENPDYFVYDGNEGEVKMDKLGECEGKKCFVDSGGNRIGNGRMQTKNSSHMWIPNQYPNISRILFGLFGYDNPTKMEEIEFTKTIASFTIFWDPLYTNMIDVEKFDNTRFLVNQEDGLHLDSDEFIWFKINEAKTLNVMELDKKLFKTLKYCYLAPQGFWHGTPKESFGVSVRLGLLNQFWNKEEWMSETHLKLIDYVNEFDIKPKIVRNMDDCLSWPFVDYSGVQSFRVKGFVPNSHSGNWKGPGHRDNIPNGL